MDYFCEAFTNAYELAVAGRCHASGKPATSHVELFDRYVQTCFPENYHVGTALLRAIAAEMAKTVSSSWERAEYERFAERFLAEKGGALTILDQLRRCRLVRVTEDFFSFEHELLADHLNATEMHRRHGGSVEFVAELRKPRNQRLIELILPRLFDDREIGAVLRAAMDRTVLSRVLAGRCGARAKAVLLRHIAEFLKLAASVCRGSRTPPPIKSDIVKNCGSCMALVHESVRARTEPIGGPTYSPPVGCDSGLPISDIPSPRVA